MEPKTCLEGLNCPITADSQLLTLIIVLVLIDLVLRGFALWRAAGNKQIGWFIALLIINSVGILPLIYLLAVKKKER